jgi:ADP-ribose pyrophosphatase YjhB (NUDIX family)/N-acetylglutamate synthase-like GNAT family acetyltransferase
MATIDCELCNYENPKDTVSAIIIEKQKIFVAKRNIKEDPFFNKWDFIGGFVQKGETPEKGLRREIKEELGVSCELTYIGVFSGIYPDKRRPVPVNNYAYLTKLKGKVKINKEEHSALTWVPLKDIKTIAFDSNQKILDFVKKNFTYDLARVKELVSQLDSTAIVDEEAIYKASLNGFVSRQYDKGKLIGMGWIFPRQTLLRKQAVVEDMIVDENYRGKGMGKKILLDLIKWAKSQGVEVVELTTNPKRVAANELYKSIGFVLHPTNHYLLKL